MKNLKKNSVALTLGAVVIGTSALTSVNAEANPFLMSAMVSGYQLDAEEVNDIVVAHIDIIKSEEELSSLLDDTLQHALTVDQLLTLFNASKTRDGLDWRTHYVDVVAAFQSVELSSLTPAHRKIALTLANVDLGIHYQSWSYQHAEQFLKDQLNLDQQQSKVLIHFIVLQPGVSIAPATQLYL
ncbi:hypothetical protein PULV_a0934 [Pseudoalteromonas ulvae UL12]|uniref:hypothetical protein n=1 Tax=Pseudoalteromonas ulvae TaxID=107327 RepID=UPI00186BA46F|nr:hypothetical protein [Pseudoalteromonas ulvae]MBE0363483.1 hypothetical protein [Pseudoalteromonas ulvae UL12]